MSIIQSLREKSAVLLTSLIALSLIGFLVQDAFIGGNKGLFSGSTSSVGSINGTAIETIDFNQKVKLMEESNRQQGMQSSEQTTQNIVDGVWNSYIQQEIISDVSEKLGIAFTPKEMGDLLFSEDAPAEFKQLFTDPNTRQYNIQAARTWLANVKKSKKTDEVKMVNDQLIEPLISRQLAEKYNSLITQGSYIPKWLLEKMNIDNSSFASMAYVMVPYATIPDSTIRISDEDISTYVQGHKEEFKQEKTRSIAFVSFDANPSATDSAALFNQLTRLKEEFVSTPNPKIFITRNNSGIPFFDGYVLKSRLAIDVKDSIVMMPIGSVVGPYLDGGSYVLARKIDTRSLPDSIKVRHILIGIVDPRTGQAIRTDSAAKKTADSIFTAIRGGADFKTLAAELSDDEGSKNNGGEYEYSSLNVGGLAKEYGDYLFYKKTGDRDIIKTEFGYHIIEILNQKNFDEAYKVAYLSKSITASEETDNAAAAAATQFAGNSRNAKSFDENVIKNKLNKRIAENIKEMDFTAANMPSRAFVKWIYNNKQGTVSEPFDFKDKYVVATVTAVYEDGVQPPSVARAQVEPIIRNQKKAKLIVSKIGSAKTLDAISTAVGQKVGEVDTLRFGDAFIPNIGPEAKVIGATFNKQNLAQVSAPIEGQTGLFTIQTKQTGVVPSAADAADKQRLTMQMKQYASYGTMEALKKAAKISDNRFNAGF
jgi:peptidyl-prolyl cis-trans isomerase D